MQNTTYLKLYAIFDLTWDPDTLRECFKREMKTGTEKSLFLSVMIFFWLKFVSYTFYKNLKCMVIALSAFQLVGLCCNSVFNHSVFPSVQCTDLLCPSFASVGASVPSWMPGSGQNLNCNIADGLQCCLPGIGLSSLLSLYIVSFSEGSFSGVMCPSCC